MSRYFGKIKDYFDNGLWNIVRVRNAVVKGRITAEEYKIITGEDYESENKRIKAKKSAPSCLGADVLYDNNFLILSTASTVLSLSPKEVRRK